MIIQKVQTTDIVCGFNCVNCFEFHKKYYNFHLSWWLLILFVLLQLTVDLQRPITTFFTPFYEIPHITEFLMLEICRTLDMPGLACCSVCSCNANFCTTKQQFATLLWYICRFFIQFCVFSIIITHYIIKHRLLSWFDTH